jgi:hypothetical protein
MLCLLLMLLGLCRMFILLRLMLWSLLLRLRIGWAIFLERLLP